MDSIDITDSTFSLDVPSIIGGGNNLTDSTIYLYIGAAILVAIIGYFVFKFYKNKNSGTAISELDCEGGFCTMGEHSVERQI